MKYEGDDRDMGESSLILTWRDWIKSWKELYIAIPNTTFSVRICKAGVCVNSLHSQTSALSWRKL